MSVHVIGPMCRERVSGKDIGHGSALRAAKILGSLDRDVLLRTYGAPQDRAYLEKLGVAFEWIATDADLKNPREFSSFDYACELAEPWIYPNPQVKASFLEPLRSASALVFGAREGRPTVLAGEVVYDPQDGPASISFEGAGGSRADRLVYSLNLSEARALADVDRTVTPIAVAEALRAKHRAEAVVIRLGPFGYLAQDQADCWHVDVPPIKQLRRKVGSGGVFSAFLLDAWTRGKALSECVAHAAAGTARYQEFGSDTFGPVTASEIDELRPRPSPASGTLGLDGKVIWLLAPDATAAERWLWEQLRRPLFSWGARVVGSADPDCDRASAVLVVAGGRDHGAVLQLAKRARDAAVVVLCEGDLLPRAERERAPRDVRIARTPFEAVFFAAHAARDRQLGGSA